MLIYVGGGFEANRIMRWHPIDIKHMSLTNGDFKWNTKTGYWDWRGRKLHEWINA